MSSHIGPIGICLLVSLPTASALNFADVREGVAVDFRKYSFADRVRLSLGGSLDTLGMAALGGDGAESALGADLTLRLAKPLLLPLIGENLSFHARLRYRTAIGETAPSALGGEIGSAWGLVNGFNDSGFEVPDFYFRQLIPEHHLDFRFGQMVIDSQFDGQPVGGAKDSFLNRAFSGHPAAAFPRLGAGFTTVWNPDGPWDFALGITTVQGTANSDQVDFKFNSDDFFTVLQFGYEFETRNEESRRLQLAIWHSDSVETDDFLTSTGGGQGLSLTYSYTLVPKGTENEVTGYTRLALADGSATDADILVVTGAVTEICPGDTVGVGAGIGRGDADRNWQGVVECFYRHEFRKRGEVSLNAQLVSGEGLTGGGAVRLIVAAGARVSF